MRDLSEADWKVYKKIHPIVQERYCQETLKQIRGILENAALPAVNRSCDIVELAEKRNKELFSFGDWRRSALWRNLCGMQRLNIIFPEEIALFTEETQELLKTFSP